MDKRSKAEQPDISTAAILRQGTTTQFWIALKKILEQNVEYLETQILEDDSLSEEVKITRRDLVRKWRQYAKELVDLPEKIADWMERPNVVGDPFKAMETNIRGIIPDDSKRN